MYVDSRVGCTDLVASTLQYAFADPFRRFSTFAIELVPGPHLQVTLSCGSTEKEDVLFSGGAFGDRDNANTDFQADSVRSKRGGEQE